VSWNTYLHLRAYAYSQFGTYSSPLADDGLLQTSASHDRLKQRLETIMIFGNKSDVKKHFSSKHSMFSHRLFVDDAPNNTTGQARSEEQSREQCPPAKVEKPEEISSKS
jgi:hypothetical protein